MLIATLVISTFVRRLQSIPILPSSKSSMAAYFSAGTVLGSILILLATLGAIFAGLGGINQPTLRDVPWLSGQVSVSTGTGNKAEVVTNKFWLGLWNYCQQDAVFQATQCNTLVNGTQDQIALFTGKATPAEQANVPTGGSESTCRIPFPS